MPWSRPRWTSSAPTSVTLVKQAGSGPGSSQALGSVVARLRDLEQHGAQRVVDLLVVPVLTLSEAPENRPEPELIHQVGVAEGDSERYDDRDGAIVIRLDLDAMRGERRHWAALNLPPLTVGSNSPCTML